MTTRERAVALLLNTLADCAPDGVMVSVDNLCFGITYEDAVSGRRTGYTLWLTQELLDDEQEGQIIERGKHLGTRLSMEAAAFIAGYIRYQDAWEAGLAVQAQPWKPGRRTYTFAIHPSVRFQFERQKLEQEEREQNRARITALFT